MLSVCSTRRLTGLSELFLQQTERVPTLALSICPVIYCVCRYTKFLPEGHSSNCQRHVPGGTFFTTHDLECDWLAGLTKHHRLRSNCRPFPFQSLAVPFWLLVRFVGVVAQ